MAAHEPGVRAPRPRARGTAALAVLGAALVIGPPVALATDAPPGDGDDSIVISVNGTLLDADVGQKAGGCTVVVEVSGLDPDAAPSTVGITVSAVAPTVPEGTTALLREDVRETVDGQLSAGYDMTNEVEAFAVKTNGYRLAVAVTVDGTSMGSRELWLACGAPQDGEPNRIVFEVRWLDAAGQPLAVPLDTTVPSGWRATYAVQASSIRGTATCTIPPGAEQLVCDYDNPGHGSEPGLVVPAGKRHTYDVAQVGLPAGWALDESTVGTFLGRDACPTGGCGGGGDHDDGGSHDEGGCGGHAEAVTLAADVQDGEDGETCSHTVVNQRLAPPAPTPITVPPTTTTSTTTTSTTTSTTSTTTTSAPTTTVATTTTTTTTAPVSVLPSEETAAPRPAEPPTTVGVVTTLPRTGSGLAGSAAVGLALLVSGLVLRASERTDRATPPPTPR